jgi:hypothetical protein
MASDVVTDALFDLEGPAGPGPGQPGRAEASLRRTLQAGVRDGTICDIDEALGEAALIGARALDVADRIGGLKGGYLAAQALPAYQKALHALRLPAEVTAAEQPRPPASGQTEPPSWLSDAFGTAAD